MASVYAVSDLHGNLPAVPSDAEVLLIAGDICPDFRPPKGQPYGFVDESGHRQAAWLDTEFRAWLEPLVERGISVAATWGNHDFVGERKFLVPKLPWTLLCDKQANVGGVEVYGTPWVPGLQYWAFYGDTRRLTARAKAIPLGIDVLMTHGPPYGHGDFIPTSEKQRAKYNNFTGEHVGDGTLNRAIERAKPAAVICGHIHEARGTYSLGASEVHNVAAVDEVYNLHDEPWVRLDLF